MWIGSTRGTVVSWSDTQIVAQVAASARSGIVQVQQGGFGSANTPSFTVPTAVITGVSPTVGVVGTSVTLTGTGFGWGRRMRWW